MLEKHVENLSEINNNSVNRHYYTSFLCSIGVTGRVDNMFKNFIPNRPTHKKREIIRLRVIHVLKIIAVNFSPIAPTVTLNHDENERMPFPQSPPL